MSGFQASVPQRNKVRELTCWACGAPGCDPAHIVSRAQGGCDHPMCVAPLCRFCHIEYDRGNLDLLPILEDRGRLELQHALSHLSLLRLLHRVTGQRWRPQVDSPFAA